jgi:RecB family endonuclease NucS
MEYTFQYYNEEDDCEDTISIPGRYEVCPQCDGHRTHLNPNIGEHAYSVEEFYEEFDDDESRTEYFKRGGRYDVLCEECHGQRVVVVPDRDKCSKEQIEALDQYEEQLRDAAYHDRCDRATQRAESGYYE